LTGFEGDGNGYDGEIVPVGAPDPIVVGFSVPTDRKEEAPAVSKYYCH